MVDSIRERVVQAAETRLQDILIANGYNYDVGPTNVFRTAEDLALEDRNFVALWDGDEEVKSQQNSVYTIGMILGVQMSVIAASDPPYPDQIIGPLGSKACNAALADVQKAMLQGDTSHAGLLIGINYVSAVQRHPSGAIKTSTVDATFEALYSMYKEDPTLSEPPPI